MSRGAASARLELCVCVLRVPRDPLARALAELGPLELSASDGDGRAPICIELWDVRDGRVSFAGVEQERLYEAGAMLVGSAYGALLGPLGSLSLGIAARSFGTALSDAASGTLGCYRELLIGVPEVSLAGAGPCYFVAGMRTDSPFAITMDRLLGYGFDKRAARFGGTLAAGLSVRDAGDGAELIHVVIDEIDEAEGARGPAGFGRVSAWLDRPLLAGTHRRLALCTLRRAYRQRSGVAVDCAELRLGALHPLLPRGEHAAVLYRARDVALELSLPSPVVAPERSRHG